MLRELLGAQRNQQLLSGGKIPVNFLFSDSY